MSTPATNLSDVQHRRKAVLGAALVTVAAAILVTSSTWTFNGPMHEAFENAGFALIVVCILGRTWCTLYVGGKKKTSLVRHGPYSLSRNPLYVFSILGTAGVGLTTGSLTVGFLMALAAFLVFDQVVRREEGYLKAAFGAPYEAYCREVPRWWPRFSAWSDLEHVEAKPKLILITFRDACLFLLAVPLLEGVEWLQASHFLPIWLQLP
jgi:protein-S-isoprenylcysteine O-methyltransferase Ste14